jgi:hypothetical protein
VKLSKGTTQQGLIITPYGKPAVTVDDLEVAQFVYLLLHNQKIRDVIDTVGKKGVLLLGRFTECRIAILERLRDELRKRGYLPIVFNFDKPETKDFTESIRLLAGLSKFVIRRSRTRDDGCRRQRTRHRILLAIAVAFDETAPSSLRDPHLRNRLAPRSRTGRQAEEGVRPFS